jgi:ribosomal-protein-alanine N-acetyltransferase
MEKDEAFQISEWHYEEPYSFYDFRSDLEDAKEFLDFSNRPEGKYFSVVDESGGLVGFYELTHKGNSIEIGLGMRPDLTGKGIGLAYVRAGIEFIQETFSPEILTLFVLSSNMRARVVYERAGFKNVRTLMIENDLGKNEFVEMHLRL